MVLTFFLIFIILATIAWFYGKSVKKVFYLILVSCLVFNLGRCSGRIPTSYQELVFQKRLEIFVEEEINEIPLQCLTNFEWEKVCVLWPYAGRDDYEKVIGMSFPSGVYWDQDAEQPTFVFLNSNETPLLIRSFRIENIEEGTHCFASQDNYVLTKTRSKIYNTILLRIRKREDSDGVASCRN